MLIEVWQVRLLLNRIGTWALLATVVVLEGEGWISEEQCKIFSANIVYVGRLRAEMEPPLSREKEFLVLKTLNYHF